MFYGMEFEANDTTFWNQVREHYVNKKKHLLAKSSNHERCFIQHYLEEYQGLSVEELQQALNQSVDKVRRTNCRTSEDSHRQDALECLLAQVEPLKPPYSQEEIQELKATMPPGTDLPPQFVEYLTQVSREILFFNDIVTVNAKLWEQHTKDFSYRLNHAPNCKCWTDRRGDLEGNGVPGLCPDHTPEQRQKALDFIEKRTREEGDAMSIRGFYIGWDTHNDMYVYPRQVLVCDQNSLFGQVYENTDGSTYGNEPDYEHNFSTFKRFVQACMHYETTGELDCETDDEC